jgi:hypothetical protein
VSNKDKSWTACAILGVLSLILSSAEAAAPFIAGMFIILALKD